MHTGEFEPFAGADAGVLLSAVPRKNGAALFDLPDPDADDFELP